jgi:hypothetical protein
MGGKRGKTKKGTYKKRINRKRANRRRTNRKQTGGTDIDINDLNRDLTDQEVAGGGREQKDAKINIHFLNSSDQNYRKNAFKSMQTQISEIFNKYTKSSIEGNSGTLEEGCIWDSKGKLLGNISFEMSFEGPQLGEQSYVIRMIFMIEITKADYDTLPENSRAISKQAYPKKYYKKTEAYKQHERLGNYIIAVAPEDKDFVFFYVKPGTTLLNRIKLKFSSTPPPTPQPATRIPRYRVGSNLIDSYTYNQE